jgi:hypothetical protein
MNDVWNFMEYQKKRKPEAEVESDHTLNKKPKIQTQDINPSTPDQDRKAEPTLQSFDISYLSQELRLYQVRSWQVLEALLSAK